MTRLACIGDIHGRFDAGDVAWLDAQDFDAVLIVGDLGGGRGADEVTVAGHIGRLRTPTFVVGGNHDGVTLPQLGAELFGPSALADRLGQGMDARVDAIVRALGPARWCGYERVAIGDIQLVVGRPHSYGGPWVGFGGYLRRAYGVDGMEASAERLTALLQTCDARPVVVLGHNGPLGLGASRTAPFGRDFHRDEGDWGDPDLALALARVEGHGRAVAAVVAGHMHHALRGGGARQVVGQLGATLVVNAAQVPRHARDGARHHVELTVTADGVRAEAVTVRSEGVERTLLASTQGP